MSADPLLSGTIHFFASLPYIWHFEMRIRNVIWIFHCKGHRNWSIHRSLFHFFMFQGFFILHYEKDICNSISVTTRPRSIGSSLQKASAAHRQWGNLAVWHLPRVRSHGVDDRGLCNDDESTVMMLVSLYILWYCMVFWLFLGHGR